MEPKEFYREIFREGELQEKGVYDKGKYNGIIVEVTKDKLHNGRNKILRHILTDDLDKIDEVIERDNFCFMSPISYIGKKRNSDNARALYALTIDLDGLIIKNGDDPTGLKTLFHQIENLYRIPMPTYIVSSGTGLHLYYVFEKPIMLFPNVVKQLQKYKRELTRIVWQGYITKLEDNVQYESLFQGFRVVGTITKKGERARAFQTGKRVTMEYMNEFVDEEFKTDDFVYNSNLTLEQAKEKYPEWYEKRIIEKQPKGTWVCKRDLYDWWKNKIIKQAKTGHRYYCMMMLAVYARKSGIDREELEKDAFMFMDKFDTLPASEDNPFTEKDVIDALQAYDDRYITYPINSISYLTDIHIEKNKRNYRKQKDHIIVMNTMKTLKKLLGEEVKEGRPNKEYIVKEYRKNNPNAKKIQCIRDTGLDKKTVYKWW
ncbi:hypothetical protein UMC2_34321 [[Clostridium] sordellii]|uniref:hypothetical protein n=1 Tax=Paraclostridium sordellii TaxID=1505 RepID=UPI000541C9BE|nr:hypothetical protein [Paeniclostridium sordellii]CEK36562.1 hypothetical protein UMC2_34321 [[Clostridium] sordellii] [Paeniclostridium sordellii]